VRIFGRRFAAFLSVSWLIGTGGACQKKADPAPTPAPAPSAVETPAQRTTASPKPDEEHHYRPFLYEVRSPDGKVSYLLGTMHLGFDYQELPAYVWQHLAASKRAVFETDARTMGDAVGARAKLPEGQKLSALLGDDLWAGLRVALPGVPVETLDRMAPWMVVSVLLARLYPTVLPVDLAVMREAERDHLELGFLEPVELQIGLLAEAAGKETIAALLDENSVMRGLYADASNAYKKGDLEALMKATQDPRSAEGGAATLDKLLYARNQAWVKPLSEAMAAGGAFVAVGAGHLGGDRGLLALLEKQGYTSRRVSE